MWRQVDLGLLVLGDRRALISSVSSQAEQKSRIIHSIGRQFSETCSLKYHMRLNIMYLSMRSHKKECLTRGMRNSQRKLVTQPITPTKTRMVSVKSDQMVTALPESFRCKACSGRFQVVPRIQNFMPQTHLLKTWRDMKVMTRNQRKSFVSWKRGHLYQEQARSQWIKCRSSPKSLIHRNSLPVGIRSKKLTNKIKAARVLVPAQGLSLIHRIWKAKINI